MTRVELTITMTTEVGHVAGKFASKNELSAHVADLIVEALEDMDGAEITTADDAEYRVKRTLYSIDPADSQSPWPNEDEANKMTCQQFYNSVLEGFARNNPDTGGTWSAADLADHIGNLLDQGVVEDHPTPTTHPDLYQEPVPVPGGMACNSCGCTDYHADGCDRCMDEDEPEPPESNWKITGQDGGNDPWITVEVYAESEDDARYFGHDYMSDIYSIEEITSTDDGLAEGGEA